MPVATTVPEIASTLPRSESDAKKRNAKSFTKENAAENARKAVAVRVARLNEFALKREDNGEKLKERLGIVAEKIAFQLDKKTPKRPEMLNLHADTALKSAKIGQAIYGWGEGISVSIVTGACVGGTSEEAEPAIDVESSTDSE